MFTTKSYMLPTYGLRLGDFDFREEEKYHEIL